MRILLLSHIKLICKTDLKMSWNLIK